MTKKGGLKLAKEVMKILGKEGLHDLSFNVSKGKVTAQQATMLNKVEEEIPSGSDVDKVGDIELQEIAKSMEDLISQIKDVQTDTDELFEHLFLSYQPSSLSLDLVQMVASLWRCLHRVGSLGLRRS